MASSPKPRRFYEVFLSFRGTDVRNNFLSHLYKALDRNGIYTFRDSEELRKGDQISSKLMKAIEESCIAIVIFSENYASSQWCLEEVAKIMECNKRKHLKVLPVFYKVDPREVRTGRKSYAKALDKHEPKHGSKKVKIWKEALFDAGSLSGWPLNDEDESEVIQEIVEEISTYLDQTPLQVAKHPVGIDSQVVKLKSILNPKSDDGVLMVGLWGPGGIGKTSLAKALYNAMFRQFDGACFLENVRENSKDSRGLVELQKKLLDDILLLWQQRLKVSIVSRGSNLIQRRLRDKRVLLILDDVDDLRQLDALAGDRKWFGNGSKIIITTRNKQLLTCHRIDQDHVYEVEALNHTEAHELLSKHAFQMHHQIKKDLVDSALNYAKGLPLALEVLGSLLCGTTEDVWESTLKKLYRNPNKDINNVLKVSYDGLDENEQEIFLHIACFFKGQGREYTMKVLECCDLEAAVGFDTLIKRSLISIEYRILKVHDLIQAMGIDIVNRECKDDPGKRSRLWLYNDVRNVLQDNKEDCAVKAIVLKPPVPIEICIGPDAFKKMRKLRLLILHDVHISFQDPICLPNELRWLEWARCGHLILEFSSGPKELVALDISSCSVTVAPNQFKGFQNLKYLNFSGCKSLVCMPDLSCTPNLDKLVLSYCENLVEAHKSIAYHKKLRVLDFYRCSKLSVFPNELESTNLQALHFANCTKFERFPDIPYKFEALEELSLAGTAIKGLPASIENLVSLERMYLSNCKNLMRLPSSIYKLQNLQELDLHSCTNLIGFPKYGDSADPCMKTGLSNLHRLRLSGCNLSEVDFLENLSCSPFLTKLFLSGNNITSLPTSINKRHCLSNLEVDNCHQLEEIPELPPFLRTFWTDNCESLQNCGDLTSVHDFIRRGLTMANLRLPDQFYPYTISLPRGEMPEWVLPIKEDSISFMVSKDLYDKFFGLALCVDPDKNNYDEKIGYSYHFVTHVNGKKQDNRPFSYAPPGFNNIILWYHTPRELWGEVDFGRINGSRVRFDLTIFDKYMKKWGFRIFCKKLEDDVKVILQDNRLIDPALLYEMDYESTYSEVKSLLMHRDGSTETDLEEDLQDHEIRMERDEQIAPKRKHELIPAQGKRIKTTSTSSDSTDGEENDREICEGSNS